MLGDGMIEIRVLAGEDVATHLDDLAALRLSVFRDWPYLYDGRLTHERQYVASYRDHPRGAAGGRPAAWTADWGLDFNTDGGSGSGIRRALHGTED